MTWADLTIFNMHDVLMNLVKIPEIVKKYPKFDDLANRVGSLPNIKHWVETAPKTEM